MLHEARHWYEISVSDMSWVRKQLEDTHSCRLHSRMPMDSSMTTELSLWVRILQELVLVSLGPEICLAQS